MKIINLSCEYRKNPIGIDTLQPRFSWQIESTKRGVSQTAYRILVADSQENLETENGNIWDSGKITSNLSTFIKYKGEELKSGAKYFWKVVIWDKNDIKSSFSKMNFWQMGLIEEGEWRNASWIGKDKSMDVESEEAKQAPYFRKEFNIDKKIKSATTYICGIGYNKLFINGMQVGDNNLDPGFTRFDRRVLYTTYDITQYLSDKDKNTFAVVLGNGFYNQLIDDVWDFHKAPWRKTPRFIMKTIITFEDNTTKEMLSDDSWKVSNGPIVFNAIRNGEYYDARLEKDGWNLSDYDDSDWGKAEIVDAPGGKLTSQNCPPIKISEIIKPISIKELSPGTFIFDFGQNFAGWCRLKASGTPGTEITLTHGEKLNEKGLIDNGKIDHLIQKGLFQTDKYIMNGKGEEIWEPSFVYHGFQYVEVKGFPGTPTIDSLIGCFAHTSFEQCGSFSCSNEFFNKIQDVTLRSYKSNFHSIPTDCPQREKNGWTGDAHLAAEMGLYNYNSATSYAKWLDDFMDEQRESGELPGIVPTAGWGYDWGNGPAWDSAYHLIAWYTYLYKGDLGILEKHYDRLKLYVDYLTDKASDKGIINLGLGDWIPPFGQEDDGPTPRSLSSTAYYYKDTIIVAKIAELLEKTEDSHKYTELAGKIKEDFNNMFYNQRTGSYSYGSQTTQSCAIYQGLVKEGEEDKVFNQLLSAIEHEDGYLNCGILGTKYIYHALSDGGRSDVANKLANNKEYPSIGEWLEDGATTLYESWDGNASRNHIMFGDISAWFYETIGGINPDSENPGFKHVLIKPEILDGVTDAKTEHYSMYGLIKTKWNIENDNFNIEISIPPNTTATVSIPAKVAEKITESGIPIFDVQEISSIKTKKEITTFELVSGKYLFKSEV